MESYYKQNKKLITDILDILEGHFGKNVEFVVHDLSLDYEHTIVDIRNGEVTGRKVGGTGDLLGLRALRYNGSNEGNCFNTLTYAENGKILRSSTLFFLAVPAFSPEGKKRKNRNIIPWRQFVRAMRAF